MKSYEECVVKKNRENNGKGREHVYRWATSLALCSSRYTELLRVQSGAAHVPASRLSAVQVGILWVFL